MRRALILTAVPLLTVITALVVSEGIFVPGLSTVANAQPPIITPRSTGEDSASQPAFQIEKKTKTNLPEETEARQPATEKQLVAEAAIREADELLVKAYDRGDAKAVAALFTADAEYVDESGNVFQGRAAIEESMTEFFAENPECKLELTVDTIRLIGPGVAVEDGRSMFTCSKMEDNINSRYTTVYVETDGKWLAASVRDHAPKDRHQHRAELSQLDWLVGEWIDEGADSIITFSCQPVDHGNFLVRQFTIVMGGEEVLRGSQRIGWDPLTGKLRTWIFDSDGAYGEGSWHRDGDNWVLKCTGVMADGQAASSTFIYSNVNEHTMTWQSVDHEIAGVKQPDSEVYSIVRQAPTPTITTVEE